MGNISFQILAFVVVLGPLIFFHELGHFLLAKFFGVGVEKFSMGFGPKLIGKKIGITEYRISAFPLGGYVKMVGEDPEATVAPEDIPLSFHHKPVIQRILIVLAGPLFNLFLALAIFYAVFQFSGEYIREAYVGKVGEETPALQAGVEAGDLITAINKTPVNSWTQMSEIISGSGGETVDIDILRNDEKITLSITPKQITSKNIFGEDVDRYIIGITPTDKMRVKELGPLEAMGASIMQTFLIIKVTVLGFGKIISGSIPVENLGGPIMIAQMAGEQAREGIINLINLIAVLSVHLAFINILPIPVLDGGHLLFFFIELVKGSPVNIRVREYAQQVGLFLLLFLMIFVFYIDLSR